MAEAIWDWHAELPPGTALLNNEVDWYEEVLELTPVNTKAVGLEFRITYHGTFAVAFGYGASFEDLEASPDYAIEICEAARKGLVTDDVRRWRGKVVEARTRMQLTKSTLSDWFLHPVALLPVGKWEHIQYQPWHLRCSDS